METIASILRKSADFLSRKGVENARLDAEWMLAEIMRYPRMQLFLEYERPLTPEVLNQLRPLVQRRGKREPLQHILGYVDFCGLRLRSDSRALIPRPETEEMVERITTRLKYRPPARILDLGTGSGAIALALAKAFPEAEILAADISRDALSLASENAERNELAHRICFFESSWLEKIEGSFDLIVSNPPYLSEEDLASAQPEVTDFEPRIALVAPEEGMASLFTILEHGVPRLNHGGLLFLETGIAQHAHLASWCQNHHQNLFGSERDLSRRERFFWVEKSTP